MMMIVMMGPIMASVAANYIEMTPGRLQSDCRVTWIQFAFDIHSMVQARYRIIV